MGDELTEQVTEREEADVPCDRREVGRCTEVSGFGDVRGTELGRGFATGCRDESLDGRFAVTFVRGVGTLEPGPEDLRESRTASRFFAILAAASARCVCS